jgi:hypothetical protein
MHYSFNDEHLIVWSHSCTRGGHTRGGHTRGGHTRGGHTRGGHTRGGIQVLFSTNFRTFFGQMLNIRKKK